MARTEYEIKTGQRARNELRENAIKMLDEMEEYDFHNIYNLMWSLTAKDLTINIRSEKREA